jgi:methionyl-tRNA synthetase
MLTFAFKNFDGAVPKPGEFTEADRAIIRRVEEAFEAVGADIDACHFRAALGKAMAVAREANRYLDLAAPWKTLKSNRERSLTATYVALRVIDSLKLLFAPFLPFSSQKLHEYLGYETNLIGIQAVVEYQEENRKHLGLTYSYDWEGDIWVPSQLKPGQALQRPKPLFRKLEEEVAEEELARLG